MKTNTLEVKRDNIAIVYIALHGTHKSPSRISFRKYLSIIRVFQNTKLNFDILLQSQIKTAAFKRKSREIHFARNDLFVITYKYIFVLSTIRVGIQQILLLG